MTNYFAGCRPIVQVENSIFARIVHIIDLKCHLACGHIYYCDDLAMLLNKLLLLSLLLLLYYSCFFIIIIIFLIYTSLLVQHTFNGKKLGINNKKKLLLINYIMLLALV